MAAPVSAARFQQFVLERQEVGTNLLPHEPLDAVAEVIAQFEGVYLPFEIWDKVVFPARVSGWSPALPPRLAARADADFGRHRLPLFVISTEQSEWRDLRDPCNAIGSREDLSTPAFGLRSR